MTRTGALPGSGNPLKRMLLGVTAGSPSATKPKVRVLPARSSAVLALLVKILRVAVEAPSTTFQKFVKVTGRSKAIVQPLMSSAPVLVMTTSVT